MRTAVAPNGIAATEPEQCAAAGSSDRGERRSRRADHPLGGALALRGRALGEHRECSRRDENGPDRLRTTETDEPRDAPEERIDDGEERRCAGARDHEGPPVDAVRQSTRRTGQQRVGQAVERPGQPDRDRRRPMRVQEQAPAGLVHSGQETCCREDEGGAEERGRATESWPQRIAMQYVAMQYVAMQCAMQCVATQ